MEIVSKLEQSLPQIHENIEQKNKAVTNEKITTSDDSEKEESAIPDSIEQDKKKKRRRKNKLGSEDPEENNVGHRVVIRDDQVRLCYNYKISGYFMHH